MPTPKFEKNSGEDDCSLLQLVLLDQQLHFSAIEPYCLRAALNMPRLCQTLAWQEPRDKLSSCIQGHGIVGIKGTGWWLDQTILVSSSKLNDSIILWFYP